MAPACKAACLETQSSGLQGAREQLWMVTFLVWENSAKSAHRYIGKWAAERLPLKVYNTEAFRTVTPSPDHTALPLKQSAVNSKALPLCLDSHGGNFQMCPHTVGR